MPEFQRAHTQLELHLTIRSRNDSISQLLKNYAPEQQTDIKTGLNISLELLKRANYSKKIAARAIVFNSLNGADLYDSRDMTEETIAFLDSEEKLGSRRTLGGMIIRQFYHPPKILRSIGFKSSQDNFIFFESSEE